VIGVTTWMRATAGSGRRMAARGGTDWFGRALAAKVYIYVNDYHEAMYLIRCTDAKGTLPNGTHRSICADHSRLRADAGAP